MTPTPEATEAATKASSTSATGERDIDPSNPSRSVPKKKANSPFLVHQKWKEEQELRRRKAAAAAAAGQDSSSGSKDATPVEQETLDLTGPLKLIVKLFRFALMATAVVMASGLFVAGDPLWGYRGKYTKLRTYLPVSWTTSLRSDCAAKCNN